MQFRQRRPIRLIALFAAGALAPFGCMPAPGGDPNDTGDPLSVELGFFDEVTGEYREIEDNGDMPLFAGLQGGRHIFATLRATGFGDASATTTDIVVDQLATLSDGNIELSNATNTTEFTLLDDGVFELRSWFIFLDADPPLLENAQALLTFELSDPDDPARSVRITRNVRLAF